MNKIQVCIIGAGPAGLTLALQLHDAGIESIILEHRSQKYVESRIRAGLLEQNTVDLFDQLKVSHRLHQEGLKHHGVIFSFDGLRHRLAFDELISGRAITIYGQQEVIKDLVLACITRGIEIRFECQVRKITDLDSDKTKVEFAYNGVLESIYCDFVAGCDGFHGISRQAIPEIHYQKYHKEYPFSWLGILAHASPSSDELIYAYHQNGFALHSMRSATVSRLYFQVDNNAKIEDYPDDKIWDELSDRLSSPGFILNRGSIFEKSITPMRSFMIDQLRYGNLFLAGDTAHIVPPTGGKGLNLAVADTVWLSVAIEKYYKLNKSDLLASYTSDALQRVWRAQEFSNFMTQLFHKQSAHGSFEYQLQKAKFDYIRLSKNYANTIAENYTGIKNI